MAEPAVSEILPLPYPILDKEKRLVPYDVIEQREMDPVFPVSGWTGKDIISAIDANDAGQFQIVELLYHAMTKEPRIGSALEQRVHMIRNFERKVLVPPSAPERLKKMSLSLDQNFSLMFPEHAMTEIMRRTVMFGFCIARQHFIVKEGQILPVIVPWTHSSCYWNVNERVYYVTTQKGEAVPVVGDPWVIFSVGGLRPWLNGAIRKLAFPFWLLMQAYDHWSSYNDTEARAIRKVRMPTMKREQIEAGGAVSVSQRLRFGDTFFCPGPKEEYDFELVTASGRGSAYKTFEDLIQEAHTEISITLLGNNLTQEIKSGSLAAATEAFNEKLRISQGDVEFIGNPLYENTTRLWVEKNFTPSFYGVPSLVPLRPKFVWDIDTKADEKERAESAQKYAQSIQGFLATAQATGILETLPIDWDATAKRCGIILKSGELPEVANHE